LEITSTPSGTRTDTSKLALSVGWSLLGYHHQAISGSFTASAPSSVRFHEVKPEATTEDGTSSYCTTIVSGCPVATGRAGVTTSSWSP
jgi:hypothetical protein